MDTRTVSNSRLGAILIAGSFLLVACDQAEYLYPNRKTSTGNSGAPTYSYGETRVGNSSVFGDGGALGGLFGRPQGEGGGGGIGVNNFLWRASLDSLSFMPLASADPFGGVIVTDWHSLPESPNERFKVNLFILGRELRADGIRAAVFRQRLEKNGAWVDAAVEEGTATKLEDAILSRARELRLAQSR